MASFANSVVSLDVRFALASLVLAMLVPSSAADACKVACGLDCGAYRDCEIEFPNCVCKLNLGKVIATILPPLIFFAVVYYLWKNCSNNNNNGARNNQGGTNPTFSVAVEMPTVAATRPSSDREDQIKETERKIKVGGIQSWLDEHKLGHLEAKLREYGVTELSDLYDLDESDLDSAGLTKLDKRKLSKVLNDEKKAVAGVPDLKSWLDEHKLGHIEAKLREYGVSAVSDLNDLDESDLDSAGIKKVDKKKLTKALEK